MEVIQTRPAGSFPSTELTTDECNVCSNLVQGTVVIQTVEDFFAL